MHLFEIGELTEVIEREVGDSRTVGEVEGEEGVHPDQVFYSFVCDVCAVA